MSKIARKSAWIMVVAAAALALAVTAGACKSGSNQAAGTAPMLRIVSPAQGAELPAGDVVVTIDVANFTIVPPGGAPVAGEGHVHYFLDVAIPTTPGQAATTAPGTYQAATATTITWRNVAAGSHTLGAQLVNKNHTPLEPPVTATVTVTVK